MDCSERGLTKFPTFSENITGINFHGNPLFKINSADILPKGLEFLYISSCSLIEIERGFIRQFASLEFLDISYNRHLTFKVLSNVTYDLQFTSIKVLKISGLYCNYGVANTLRLNHMQHLRNTSLEEIDISDNRIALIEQFVLASLPETVTSITASLNRFTFGWYMLEFSYLKNLKYLSFSGLNKYHGAFLLFPFDSHCTDSGNLHVSHDEPTKPFPKKPFLTTRVERKHNLTSCLGEYVGQLKSTNRYTVYICAFSSLEHLDMSHSLLRTDLTLNHIVIDFRNLKTFNVNNNMMETLAGRYIVRNLVKVDLSDNMIVTIDAKYLNEANFTGLNLANNYLGKQIEKAKFHVGSNLRNLTYLSLSNNWIYNIPMTLFDGCNSLQYLDLSQNELEKVNFNLQSLTELRMLDLSHNRIKTVSQKQMIALGEIARARKGIESPIVVDLSKNDLWCNCDNVEFLRWMKEQNRYRNIKFHDFESYSCSFANLSQSNFTDLSAIVMELDKQCASFTWIIVTSVIGVTTLLVSVLVGIAYRFRWKIRYLYYMAKRIYKRNEHIHNINNEHRNSMFRYDAFVSYATENSEIALHEMIREVEKQTDLKLCFHQRDFIPGYGIAENIANAIHDSRKVICVISNSFLDSHWCMYEFNMALMERIHAREGEDLLFLVLLKDFNVSRAPLPLIEFIRNNSYLEYPEDEAYRPMFWSKLVDTISI